MKWWILFVIFCVVVRLDSPVADIVLKEDAGTVFLYNIVKIVETELDIVIAIEIRSGKV